MNISPEKIAPPVALVLVGSILIVLGVIGIIPIVVNPPFPLDTLMRIVLIILGIFLLSMGSILIWRETNSMRQVNIQLSSKDIRTISNEVVKQLRPEILAQINFAPRSKSLFEERISHFREEKQHLADHFLIPLLLRCQEFAEEGKQVHLIIDSGTTLYPLFGKLAEFSVRAYANREKWIENLFVETNNIPGVIMLMDSGRINPNDRYSPLAINCDLLPGIPLPVYSALTGKKTIAALQQLRNGAGDKSVFIALTTGNWIRLRRSMPSCPVPLARGIGHLEFKQALIDYSDEVYVISPLGKIFIGVSPGEVNLALDFDEKRAAPDRQPYHEVRISDEKAPHLKMVTTSRELGCVLSEHSTKVRTVLGVDTLTMGHILHGFHRTPTADLPHLIFPFDKIPNDWQQQIETEFPHPHTRNDHFMQNFFFVPPNPRLITRSK